MTRRILSFLLASMTVVSFTASADCLLEWKIDGGKHISIHKFESITLYALENCADKANSQERRCAGTMIGGNQKYKYFYCDTSKKVPTGTWSAPRGMKKIEIDADGFAVLKSKK